MSKYYVITTGARGNAGDFLITERARLLLEKIRPDREVKVIPRYKKLNEESLELVNNSEAVLITGGPALQFNFYPEIVCLADDLSQIKTEILTFGIGYKDAEGNIENTLSYNLSKKSKVLLSRINESPYQSSVRDYNTQLVLNNLGFQNFEMTGCPALYTSDLLDDNGSDVLFSVGFYYKKSPSMLRQQLVMIESLAKRYGKKLKVIFHHQVDKRDKDILRLLDELGIRYVDISGGLSLLVENYSRCSLHIGFRVHAHIFMTSLSKRSILIAEDGRGKALHDVLGGNIVNSFNEMDFGLANRIKMKFGIKVDPYNPIADLPELVGAILDSEPKSDFPKFDQAFLNRDFHYNKMVNFIKALP